MSTSTTRLGFPILSYNLTIDSYVSILVALSKYVVNSRYKECMIPKGFGAQKIEISLGSCSWIYAHTVPDSKLRKLFLYKMADNTLEVLEKYNRKIGGRGVPREFLVDWASAMAIIRSVKNGTPVAKVNIEEYLVKEY